MMAVSLSLISRRLLAVGLWGDSGSEELSEDPSDPASKAKVKKSLFTATYTFQISPTCTLRRATGDGGLENGLRVPSTEWMPHPNHAPLTLF